MSKEADSSPLIEIRRYVLFIPILLVLLSPAILVRAAPVFSDGFESGDLTAWSGSTGAPTVNSTIAHHDTYSVYVNANEKVYYTWVNCAEYYARGYVYITEAPGANNEFFVIWDGNTRAFAGVIESGGSLYWRIRWVNSVWATVTQDSVGTLIIGHWYCVELHWIMATNGGVQLWIDGVLTLTASGITANNVTGGICYGENPIVGTNKINIDCCEIDVAYIGADNSAPTNDALTITNMDDTDNLYAQRTAYLADFDCTDTDGYADIATVDFSIEQGGVNRMRLRFDEDTNTFSIEGGDLEYDIVIGSCSHSHAGNTLNVTFAFMPEWDAFQESNIELAVTTTDASAASDTDVMQTNYADVVTSLLATALEGNNVNIPDRQDVGTSITVAGSIRYADDPGSASASALFPPDVEFTSVALHDVAHNVEFTDATVVNGDISGSFTLSATVGTDTYHLYVDMTDIGYTDGDETAVTEQIIGDQIRILTLTQNYPNLESGFTTTYTATADLEYDAHTLGVGDTFVLEGVTFFWEVASNTFKGSRTQMSPSIYTIDQYTSGTEATYTIAGGTINGLSITTTWIDLPGEIPPDTGSASKNTNMILIIGLIMGLAFYTTRPKRRTRGSLNVLFGEKKRKGDS